MRAESRGDWLNDIPANEPPGGHVNEFSQSAFDFLVSPALGRALTYHDGYPRSYEHDDRRVL